MTKAIKKITLSRSRDIPFNKLVLSQSTVRRVNASVLIEQLAESIALHTLLQSVNARVELMEGRPVLTLDEGLQLRLVRVMGAHGIELSGFSDAMRNRLKPAASSMGSSPGSCACSCRPTRPALGFWPRYCERFRIARIAEWAAA